MFCLSSRSVLCPPLIPVRFMFRCNGVVDCEELCVFLSARLERGWSFFFPRVLVGGNLRVVGQSNVRGV